MNGFSPNRLNGQSLLASLSSDAPDSRVGWAEQRPTAFLTDELVSGHIVLMPGERKIGNPTVQVDDHTDKGVMTPFDAIHGNQAFFNRVNMLNVVS